ncbi:hypothetical protein SAMN04487919_13149 [Bacillus sp. ok061]|uniref:hypothetical protein n=1 Tax=Bacillus sp. ok061 TaxID=1761766 RepID=UPI00089EF670|nr:hypothetical protein [Bacillus sp. ok061]SEG81623.1 hypothetical protein SAMN04487919_13149 [Bacillus sp. ok061]
MDKKEIAKDLTIAFFQNKSGLIRSVDDAVLVYEKFYEAVHRSASLVSYTDILPENYIRNDK